MDNWEACMQFHAVLPFLFTVFSAVSLSAQKPIPTSTEQLLSTIARVNEIKASDLNVVVMKAYGGDRQAQYLLAHVYEQEHLLKRDLAVALAWMSKSAAQGYVPAELALGLLYLREPTDSMPVGEYGRAARW